MHAFFGLKPSWLWLVIPSEYHLKIIMPDEAPERSHSFQRPQALTAHQTHQTGCHFISDFLTRHALVKKSRYVEVLSISFLIPSLVVAIPSMDSNSKISMAFGSANHANPDMFQRETSSPKFTCGDVATCFFLPAGHQMA